MTKGFVPIILALGLAAAPSLAGERHRGGMSISTGHDGPVDSCAQIRVTFGDLDAARAEETFTVAARGSLKMRAPSNSGIFVHGAAASDFAVT
ncbi:MAG TPA: hypothetical protein VGQ32_09015, partial [Thermoanaerobaculia bacterium]|nr:hypothetical protein [Thermoanaerobaculia bacterium]